MTRYLRALVPLLTVVIGFLACSNGSPTAASTASGFVSSVDGTRLRYTINWPDGNGPFPAVVLVHGSGRVTRADQQFLSDQFTSRGWAVLNYDKRGVGESDGVYAGVGPLNSDSLIPLLASDAAAALRLLGG
ncbi:MAG: CocE/NonD family hydrolase, partial [Gemmatimonadaceae bacterium]